jgi:protocatechuate 3,4-dioxygenase beta subunit
MTRRQAMAAAAATVGIGLAVGKNAGVRAKESGARVCILTPEAMQGPFYFDPKLVRADITEDRPGAPLALTLQVVDSEGCAPLEDTRVDVWHSDALGVYSGYARQETGSTEGETFLRGTQFTGAGGEVEFNTIYPGWYPGRTPHIHFKVILDETNLVTGQLYFPDDVTERVYATASPYRERKAERDTYNANDFIFEKQGGADTVVSIEEEGGSYLASLVVGVDRAGGPTRS